MMEIVDLFGHRDGGRDRGPPYDADPSPPGVVFFALNPDTEAAAGAQEAARYLRAKHRLTGILLGSKRLHVTLWPIGYFPALRPDEVEAAGAAASAVATAFGSFEAAFDRAESFLTGQAKLPLVLVGDDGVAKVKMLRLALGMELRRRGLPTRRLHGYTPHMTLLYDRRAVPKQRVEPVRWTVRELVLIHSHYGHSRHVPIARWPLRG